MKIKFTILLLLITVYSTSFAQLKYGNQLFGGSIGFSGSNTSAMIGANYEYQLPQAELGTFAVGFLGRYWAAIDNAGSSQVNSTVITLASQINYNFNTIGNRKFVPFAGIAFGYRYVTTKYRSYDGYSLTAYDGEYKNGFLFWGQGGFRYFFSRKVAGSLRLGLSNLNFSTIELGLDYKFR